MIRNARISYPAPNLVHVVAPCAITGKAYELTVDRAGFEAWQAGTLIQTALPDLPADQREFLISGTSPEGWNSMFGGMGEDDGEDEDGAE